MTTRQIGKVHPIKTLNGRVAEISSKSSRTPVTKRRVSGGSPRGSAKGRRGSLNASGQIITEIELFERSKKSWIAGHFSKRECIRYIAAKLKPEDTRELCSCGRLKEDHGSNVLHQPGDTQEIWTPEKCTTLSPTDAYGEIDFLGGHNKRAPFVRVSHDTNPKLILRLLLERWRLEAPNLIISVTGGAKSFVLKPKLKEVFRKGLMKAAKTTGAWIVTGGTNTGVMKHVGEAVKEQQLIGGSDNRVNVIGIATWGIVDGKDSLIAGKGEVGKYPALYRMDNVSSSGALLDSNHSHFILVDNGTEGKYGVEIDLRSKIEEAIMKLKTESRTKEGSIGVPVVLLVLEGGPNTVKTMYELIKKKIPAVVVDGSGRAANVVAFAYSHTIKQQNENGDTITVINPAYEKEVKDKVMDVFSFLGEQGVNDLYEMIVKVLEDEKMITVYRLEDGDIAQDIDLVILKSLLKANRSSPLAQLNLALAWNRIDVAESELFTDDKTWTTKNLRGPMLTALLDDKPQFVELFLQNGLSMREFLTLDILCQLYNGIPINTTIKPLLLKEMQKRQGQSAIDMQAVGKCIENLMGDAFHSHYLTEPGYFSRAHLQRPVSARLDFKIKKKQSTPEILMQTQLVRDEPLSTSHLDVFVWSVLCNRRGMARMLWENSREPIASALMASKMLKGMADIAHQDDTITDISSDLREHADVFEELATGVLNECYEDNEELTQTLLVKELNNFGKLTCLDLAAAADLKNFIAHTSCQGLLTRLWMGSMAMNTPWYKVLLCMVCPPLIVPVIYFAPDEQENKKEAQQMLQISGDTHPSPSSDKKLLPAYNNPNISSVDDEEASAGIDCEDFAIQDYIPDLHEDDALEVVMRQTDLNCCQRILAFYEAPFSKFVGNVLSYITFIVLYAYMILMNFQSYNTKEDPILGRISYVEIVLYFWIITVIIEEFRQISAQQPKAITDKITLYFSDSWNFLDVLSLFAFTVAVILRFFESTFEAARIILALDIVLFVVRSLQIFSVNRLLGPKLVMIRKMMEDLKQFIIILMVFIISFGIAQQAVLFPGPQFPRGRHFLTVIRGIVEWPYWQMYGELFLDEIHGEKVSDTGPINEIGTKVSPFLLAIYMLFTNILLLNLLIAIFNYTFERVQEDSDKVWKFQRYDLVSEYHGRPVAAPPLVFIGHIIIFIRWIWQLCRCGNPPSTGGALKIKLTEFEQEQLMNWEFSSAEAYCHFKMAEASEHINERVRTVNERVDTITKKLDRVMDSVEEKNENHVSDYASAVPDGNLEERLARLEAQLLGTSQSVNAILTLLQKGQESLRQPDPVANSESETIKLLHHKARSSPYPQSTVRRFDVPDDKVAWKVAFPEYKPQNYTASSVLQNPPWADQDIMSMPVQDRPKLQFNKMDPEYKVNRMSYTGTYTVRDGLPLNPMGRTGMVGRGLLGRFGPNHAADPIVTRWKRNSAGVVMSNGKKVLEFVSIQRKDNNQWAIPGGMVEPGQAIGQALKAEFGEEAMARMSVSEEEREKITKQLNQLFQHGVEVYKGYVDDPRNTDNAWMETIAMNYHDDTGDIFSAFKLQAGDDAQAVRWQRVSGNIPLYASHVSILEKVAKMRDASF